MKNDKNKYIRNFSIIAHIDHGKSTIADRLIELTETVEKRKMQNQLLDNMDLEREKGITIKAHPLTMLYKAKNGNSYKINLIDTPGHVDFSYEVSRSLSACEGALLVIDAAQGIQAQTLTNVYLAMEKNLELIPVINKIDLPAANVENVKKQIEELICIDSSDVILCSAKTGIGISDILEKIILQCPPPQSSHSQILKGLIFDSYYDAYRGVMAYVRIMSGKVEKGSVIKFMSTGKSFEVQEVGIFTPQKVIIKSLQEGEVGYIAAGIKDVSDINIGDTITSQKTPAKSPLPGFKIANPVVFASIYCIDSSNFESLRDALKKLQLNDSSLKIEQESNATLGFGFRCGFLGLLHLEIIFERIRREFDLDIITTSPNVAYKVHLNSGECIYVDNPAKYPERNFISFVEEPFVKSRIIIPSEFMGNVINLGIERRGECINTETLDYLRVILTYMFPLNEIITDFSDKLKSMTKGYGSFDYAFDSYKKSDVVKLDIIINGEPIPPFSMIVNRGKARLFGKQLCEKLKEVIPRHQFKIAIQAAIGGEIVARENLSGFSKDVTAKCYGGDVTRKRKLLEKQKKGKEKMKKFGKVNIPQESFIKVLKSD